MLTCKQIFSRTICCRSLSRFGDWLANTTTMAGLIPRVPSMARSIDLNFRSVLILSKLFTKSWGRPDTLKQMAKYRCEVMSQRKVIDHVNEIRPRIHVSKETIKDGIRTIDGHFTSPHAIMFPETMPGPIACAHFRAYLPVNPGPLCIHLAGTGDHSYFRRSYLLVEDLLKDGIGAILIQNPFYGDRKPPHQFRSSLENVSDLFVMGAALIAECNYLFSWARQRGYGPFAISGISMGGFMAQLAGSNSQHPLAIVPILSWTTASPAYTNGAISPAVNYPKLQQQLEDANYLDKIRSIPNVDWIEEAKEMTHRNGEQLAKNMMRILMNYFTSLENYPKPLNTKLCKVFLAEEDMYVTRDDDTPTYEQLWPDCSVEMMNGHGHITSFFMNHPIWRKSIREILQRSP